MENYLTIALLLIQTIGIIFVFIIQKKRINSLESNNKNLTDLIQSLKTYSDILDVNKIKDFIEFKNELAFEKAYRSAMSTENFVNLKKHFESAYAGDMSEFLTMAVSIISKIPFHDQTDAAMTLFPKNYQLILSSLGSYLSDSNRNS
jgi:hypothetical protein